MTKDSKALEEHIARTVAEWPPLAQAQIDRLAILFRDDAPSVGPAGASALAEMLEDE